MELFSPYIPTIYAMGSTGLLMLIQLLVADLAGLKSHHKPGTPVAPDTESFMFRATRSHANTNESVAIFILLAVSGLLSSVPPQWLNVMAWVYVVSRAVHMLCYYANQAMFRTIAFGISLAALFGMCAIIAGAWLT